MDTKDPVWDDDETGTPEEGFRRQVPAPEPPADASSETVNEPDETATPELTPEPTTDPSPEPTPQPESAQIPPPPGGRMRVEPVSGLSNPAPGGGRRERLARERNERSSTSLVIIALLLFVISVISISVYFFSRPATDEGSTQTAQTEQAPGEQPQSAAEEGPPEAPAPETTDANAGAQQPPSDTTPPPPAPAPASMRPQRMDVAVAKKPSGQQPETRKDVAETTPRPQSTPRPSARQPEAAQPPAPSLKTTKSADAAGAQWVVQVHSSPSIDDADEWLQQLQSRNIADGRIEPVTQKGAVWYRVRFGRFATRQEAEQAALERGYRNAWVDRVR